MLMSYYHLHPLAACLTVTLGTNLKITEENIPIGFEEATSSTGKIQAVATKVGSKRKYVRLRGAKGLSPEARGLRY